MIKVYGASDDLVVIEGDINEEFSFYSEEEQSRFLAFSDGTLLTVRYDSDGIWRIFRQVQGKAKFSKVEGDAVIDTPDVVTLDGDIFWVVLAEQSAIKKV